MPVPTRFASIVLFGMVLAMPAGARAELDLPVRTSDRAAELRGRPSYAADVLEIRLAAPAAAAARPAYRASHRPGGLSGIGVPALDRLAAEFGAARFEPEFRGETAPGPGETDFTAFYIVHLPEGTALEDALARFRALPEVASANPIAILPLARTPNDSLWSQSWWFEQAGPDIAAPAAWDTSTGDTSIVVAVLDTGVLPYHPDLGGTVAGLSGNLWTNWAERGGIPGVDDDANGFVDDERGWDFVDGVDAETGEDGDVPDPDPNDFTAHGTAVAGMIGALTDNTRGISGTAWQVRILPLRVAWSYEGAPHGSGEVRMDFARQAIRYATRMGAHVINCSFANLNTDGLDAAARAASRAGVTIVVSAGNNGDPNELDDRPDVINVTATNRQDQIPVFPFFANIGPTVDLAAPGVEIRSTWVVATGSDSVSLRQPAYVPSPGIFGTSFSAPLVSGAVALLQSRRRTLRRDLLHPLAAQLRLRENADDISGSNPGLEGQIGSGRLNLARALSDDEGSFAFASDPTPGAPVVMRSGGITRVAFVSESGHLAIVDGATLDTIQVTDLPDAPVSGLAAADMGGDRGVAMFFATVDGRIAGYDEQGLPLAGWPTGTAAQFRGGPALGDLDGNGELEVVASANDASVWAWNADGTVRSGFPVSVGSAGIAIPVALTPIDANPGVEIVAANEDGRVTVIRHTGSRLPGWTNKTVEVPPLAPVVTRRRIAGQDTTVILIAASNQLHAFAPNGSEYPGFPVTLGGSVVTGVDPALGDLDGDGADDIVLVTSGPNQVEARDSSGTMLAGWPHFLAAAATGPPMLGHLAPGSAPELAIPTSAGWVALLGSGTAIAGYPRFGRAGSAFTLHDLDRDGTTEVLAGSGLDSVFYVYESAPHTEADSLAPWFTARGNFARTGSRLYAPPLAVPDLAAPGTVTDLSVTDATDSSLTLAWTASGDDGHQGRPLHYLLAAAEQPFGEGDFDTTQIMVTHAASVDAGGRETVVLAGLAPARRWWIAVKAVDASGNRSAISNLATGQTRVGGPLGPRRDRAIGPGTNPTRLPAFLYWQPEPGEEARRHTIHIFDVTGRLLRTLEAGTGIGGVVTWDGADKDGARLPAGLYLARLDGGTARARTRIVLLP
jgi:hypothetical protein